MNKKIKFILISIVLFLLLLLITMFIINIKLTNDSKMKIKESLVTIQSEYEKDFNTKGYTLDNPKVVLDPYKASPLTALVLFETEDEESVKVTIKGKDELSTYTNTFDKTDKHYIPIYGLYADYNNEIILESGKEKKVINIKTDKLPEDFILPTSVYANKDKLNNDLYFYTPSSKGYTCAYDVNGDVRWYLTNYALWDISRLENGHILISTERLVNTPYYMTGMYEIDLLGKIYTEYSMPGGYHHDYAQMPNGNLLVASDDFNNENGTDED